MRTSNKGNRDSQSEFLNSNVHTISGGYKGVARDAPPPPPGAQILSISCSFWENLAKSYVGAPPPGELAPPPRGNPGSATAYYQKLEGYISGNTFHQCMT